MDRNWFSEATIYHSYPLGMVGALDSDRDSGINRIAELSGWIPYWKDLGIDSLFLGPVFESEYHGYDTVDFHQIDRRLGDWDAMMRFSEDLKSSGLRLLLDGVFNHVGKGFFAFQDVITHRESSVYRDWFFIDFSHPNGYEPFSYRCWEGHPELVELNLQNHDLREYLFGAVRRWISDFGISGIRLDVAYSLDHDFMRDLSLVCQDMRKDFILLGEVIHGDYRVYDMLDSVTNYSCYKGLYSSHNDHNCYEVAYELNREFGDGGLYRGRPLYNFVDNHDVNRVASLLGDPRHLYTVYTLLFTIPGVPSLYYGSEMGLEGERSDHSDGGLRPRLRMGTSGDETLKDHIRKLISLRKGNDALKYGDYRQVLLNNEYFGFSRFSDEKETLVLINISDEPVHIQVEGIRRQGFFRDEMNGGETLYIEGGVTYIKIPPNWCRVLTSVDEIA